jgi:hypothetical protein
MSGVQIGGMALRDGVLLQSDRYWASAVRVDDGTVKITSGAKTPIPGQDALRQVPLVRGLARLAESLAVLPAVRRANGKPVLPQEDPRLLAATAASAVATVALRGTRRGSPLLKEIAVAGISLAPLLLMLRDSRLARYHGAEHKSIAAYEGGVDAAGADKEHARCGSNLIAPMLLTSVATSLVLRAAGRERQPLATFVGGLVSIGTAMERKEAAVSPSGAGHRTGSFPGPGSGSPSVVWRSCVRSNSAPFAPLVLNPGSKLRQSEVEHFLAEDAEEAQGAGRGPQLGSRGYETESVESVSSPSIPGF